LKTKYKL